MNYKQILCFFVVNLFWVVIGNAQITTSIPILTLITKEIVGTEIKIQTLISSSEAAHHFELSPKSLLLLSKQDLIIFNGLNLEQSLLSLKNKPLFASKIIEATHGITPLINKNGQPDPHAWHDPEKLIIYIDTITQALEKTYPQQKQKFQANSSALKRKLTQWKKEKLSLINRDKTVFLMITPHDGFQYLAQTFGFTNLSLIEDHHGESLSPKDLVLKIKELKNFSHRSFFGDGGSKDSTLKSLAHKTESFWAGTLWGEAPPSEVQSTSLMEYLDHNFQVLWLAYQTSSPTTLKSK